MHVVNFVSININCLYPAFTFYLLLGFILQAQISYCSFVKEEKIFCFLSRESSRFEEVHQYVHLFTTSQSIVSCFL